MANLIIGLYVLATSAALILLKLGSANGAPLHVDNGKLLFNINLAVMSGIALYGISFILYVYLISKYDLGYIIPLGTALVYTIIFIASFLIFKEVFTFTKVTAIVLIIGGLILLNIPTK